jgi:hypothetical protein
MTRTKPVLAWSNREKKRGNGTGRHPAQQQHGQAVFQPDKAKGKADGHRKQQQPKHEKPADPPPGPPHRSPNQPERDRQKAQEQQEHHAGDGVRLKRRAQPGKKNPGRHRRKGDQEQHQIPAAEHDVRVLPP